MTRRSKNQGFTLVEILIVVVILGILAAIVIPQFTSASETAKGSSVVSQLQTIRSQLELYQVQHNGNYPTLTLMQQGTDDWEVLTLETDAAGATGTGNPFGPYLQKAPVNPFTNSSLVGDAGSAASTDGWSYDEATGVLLIAMSDAIDLANVGLDSDDVETFSGGGT